MLHARRLPVLALLTASVLLGAVVVAPAAPRAKSAFRLVSVDPALAVSVPLVYTADKFGCTGGNTSPALAWSGAPAGTQSYVVTLFDRDERSTPSGWWHWVVYDLPATVHELPQGAGAEDGKSLPAPARQGRTDLGNDAYHGPCPAQGDPPHRYVFTIYALDVAKLPVDPGASGAMVTSVAQDHVLAKAVFVAHYGR
jgi:Raf kinase inhibitor-like YbhB/YbcL family protein